MSSIEKRQSKQKEELLKLLKDTPIVQIICQKSGVSRATYYRWKKDDQVFAEAAETALLDGELLVNDLAESKLMSAIREQNLTAIIFWLKHHHPKYATKVEVTTSLKQPQEALSPEQEDVVSRALAMAGLLLPQAKEINEQS